MDPQIPACVKATRSPLEAREAQEEPPGLEPRGTGSGKRTEDSCWGLQPGRQRGSMTGAEQPADLFINKQMKRARGRTKLGKKQAEAVRETGIELVTSIGFQGLLFFPNIRNLNRKFILWLMDRVDPLTSSLEIDDKRRIEFDKHDVGHVFGIPTSGISLGEMGKPRVEASIKRKFLGIEAKDNRSIKAAKDIIEKEFKRDTTPEEENAFKIAFVVYVMATLLCPGAKYDYASVEYWNAIQDPDKIRTFDWSQYVLQKLLDGVVKVKTKLMNKKKVPNITGCALFLEILYLDSLELGIWTSKHDEFPRIRAYNPEKIKSMILADRISSSADNQNPMYGKSQLRDNEGICYHWASRGSKARNSDAMPQLVALWEATRALAGMLCIPMEVAGLIYCAISEFDQVRNHLSRPSGILIIKAMVAIIKPFVEGFKYNCGVQRIQEYTGHSEEA